VSSAPPNAAVSPSRPVATAGKASIRSVSLYYFYYSSITRGVAYGVD
jgi:hypothetical protein